MGTFSVWHWLIVLAVVLILFGGSGKISSLMGDMAKGIKSFKKGLAEDPDAKADESGRTIEHGEADRAAPVQAKSKSEA
jgi:sec-independent protein translocase protein TatA